MQLIADIFENDRSSRRGGENSARFDFSTRRENSGAIFGLTSSCAGLKNKARFDVSLVAIAGFGMASAAFFALFFNDPGVFRPRSIQIQCIHNG